MCNYMNDRFCVDINFVQICKNFCVAIKIVMLSKQLWQS